MIRDIVHLNVNVTDLDRSLDFYGKLGFRVMHVFGDAEKGMSFDGARVRGAVLTLGDHPRSWTKLELLEWVDPPGGPAPERSHTQAGVARIALRTKNLRGFVDELRDRGIAMEGGIREVDLVGAKRFALFRDPDGTLLELVEF